MRNPPPFQLDLADGRARCVDAVMVATFVHEVLLHPARTLPVVGVTTEPEYERCFVDEQLLAAKLIGVATVVVIPTGQATRFLTRELSGELGVHHGYVRVWMPGLRCSSPDLANPRIQIDDDRNADAVVSSILLAARHAPRLANRKAAPCASAALTRPALALVKSAGSAVPFDPKGPLADLLGNWHGDCFFE